MVMKMTKQVQESRRRALEAARKEQQQAAERARDNLADLARAFQAQERLEDIDVQVEKQIAEKTAELRARAEGRRAKEREAVGAAFASMLKRGTAVKDIARQACVSEKEVRDLIASAEAGGPAGAKPKASGAGQVPPVSAGEASAQPSEPAAQLAG